MKSRNCVVVFAREPQLNRVKTRLEKRLTPEECLLLYKAFVEDTLEAVRELEGVARVLAYDAGNAAPEYLRKVADGFLLYKQTGQDLGQRLYNAFSFAGSMYEKVVIIGSDSPNLPHAYIKEAFSILNGRDMVLGPSQDGGYYLIGLKENCRSVFDGVRWSEATVFERTMENARRLGKRVGVLKDWYDVDDYAGLSRLRGDLNKNKNIAPWTRKFLKIQP